MIFALLGLELIDGPVIPAVGVIALVLLIVVVARQRRPGRLAIGAVAGAVTAVAVITVSNATRAFGVPLPGDAAVWTAIGVGGAGLGIAALWGRGWLTGVLAALLVVAFVVLGALGVNRAFGITHTLASIIGVQSVAPITLPVVTPAATAPALSSWTPPADMPSRGAVGALSGDARIPSPGFAARDAAIYLPPAALVAAPPKLPLLVFMMGQPGTPEPTQIARTLDAYAAQHQGIAPIAIIADQLGAPTLDPACQDSQKYGAVASYFTKEIPAYARTHLNVRLDAASWAIGGYSNGGACALLWGVQHPEIWGSILDVSGNEFPGSESVDATTAAVFGGDRAAFEAAKPAAVMAAASAANPSVYAGHTAVFTFGAKDDVFGPGTQANAAAARAAGYTVRMVSIPGAGHVGAALDDGLIQGFAQLAPALGLP